MKGLFIVIEGIGGVGKSTVKTQMADVFRGLGFEVVLTREPGGTPAAEHLRQLVRGGFPMDDTPFDPMGVALLFNAARADHMSKVIQPALDAGKIVLCDRFCDSTFTYQHVYNNLPIEKLVALHELAIGVYPDMTFLLDAPAEVAAARVSEGEKSSDQFDRAGIAMQEQMRHNYLCLAAMHPERYEIIDATRSENQVYFQLFPELNRLAREYRNPTVIVDSSKGASTLRSIVSDLRLKDGIKDR